MSERYIYIYLYVYYSGSASSGNNGDRIPSTIAFNNPSDAGSD